MLSKRLMKWLGLTVALTVLAVPAMGKGREQIEAPGKAKNVIFMVPDGCSQSIQTLARWYKGSDLTLDSMNAGMVRIDMANSVITGSAAAATAFATGHKTTVRFLSVTPRASDVLSTFEDVDPDNEYAPMATILEMAKSKGKATGLVATSRITHATPAAFASHIHDRGLDNEIMEHMVYNGMTVVLGGGRRHLLPTSMGGKRSDGENLEQVLKDRGYDVVTTKSEMESVAVKAGTKLWGAFDMSHMAPDIDRQHFAPQQPSIAEMTAKAIDVLSRDNDGFFLMVEGSQVDWAGHNNDPIYMTTDFLAFDKAVKVAVDFASQRNDTVVVAFADHNTGGMKIGHYYTDVPYTATTVEDLVDPLKGMTMSANGVTAKMRAEALTLAQAVQMYWGITLTAEDITEIEDLESSVGLSYALARVVSKNHTIIGWTTHGHNGEDVPVWVYPNGYALGTIDNTELPLAAVSAWRAKGGTMLLDDLTAKLFIDVEDAFPGEWMLDMSDSANPVLLVRGVRMPVSKDYAVKNGKQHDLGSLVVHAPMTGRVFIPESAVDLINN